MLGLRLFTQFVDCTAALVGTKMAQSYLEMQILENILEHGQGIAWFFIVMRVFRAVITSEARPVTSRLLRQAPEPASGGYYLRKEEESKN